jgi:hypothetical protein
LSAKPLHEVLEALESSIFLRGPYWWANCQCRIGNTGRSATSCVALLLGTDYYQIKLHSNTPHPINSVCGGHASIYLRLRIKSKYPILQNGVILPSTETETAQPTFLFHPGIKAAAISATVYSQTTIACTGYVVLLFVIMNLSRCGKTLDTTPVREVS